MHGEPATRTCSIYRGRGQVPQVVLLNGPPEQPSVPRAWATSATSVSVREVMSPKLICARPDLDIGVVVHLMLNHHIGCLPVVDDCQRPIGIITKSDVVEQLDAVMSSVGEGFPLPQDLHARCAEEIMMPLAFTLPECATVAHAASMMILEDTHHVLVVSAEKDLVGVVSSRDIVSWLLHSNEASP